MTLATNYIKNWQDVVDHVLACYPEEACGIITAKNKFIPVNNIAEDKLNCFEMDSSILVEYDVKAILHSHTYDPREPLIDDPRIPSKTDLQGQIDTALEWCIVVCEGSNVTVPFWWGDRSHRPALNDRDFIHSLQDCLAYVSDWMYLEHGLDLPYYARDFDWTEQGLDLFEEQSKVWPFDQVTDGSRMRGDITFYKIQSDVVNHIGVMLDQHTVAHHMFGRRPITEPFSKWEKHVSKVFRLRK